jgi:hypothetical protein
MKLTLTDYETGLPVYVDTDRIAGIRQLAAFSDNLICQEEGERTRIDTTYGDILLVRESADSFASKAGWTTAPDC